MPLSAPRLRGRVVTRFLHRSATAAPANTTATTAIAPTAATAAAATTVATATTTIGGAIAEASGLGFSLEPADDWTVRWKPLS